MTLNKTKSIKHICLVLFSFLIFLSTSSCNQPKQKEENLSTKEKNALHPVAFRSEVVDLTKTREIIKNKMVVIIDLRTIDQYRAGHIPHAIQIDCKAANFEIQISNLNRKHHYLLYSDSKEQTASAAKVFLGKGFLSIKEYLDGWEDWKNAGGSIEK